VLDKVFEVQLQKLIIEPLIVLRPLFDSPLVMVIDALDECEDYHEIAKFMTYLSYPTAGLCFPWRFFITSRNDPAIQIVIENTNINPPQSRCDLTQFPAHDDIRLYLEHNLQRIRDMHATVPFELPWPSMDQLDALVRRSSGLFIYASTAVKFIAEPGKYPPEQLNGLLNDQAAPPLSDLDQLYKQVLSTSPAEIEELRLVLGTIVLVRSPLCPRTLGHLLGMRYYRLMIVFKGLHSILSIPETGVIGPVTAVHLSLGEFLTSSKARAGDFFVDPKLKHMDLTKRCLAQIRTLPKFTFLGFADSKRCLDAVMAHLDQCDSSERLAIRYACRYWSSHLLESSPTSEDFMNDMKDFCRHYVLPWRMFTEIDSQREGTPEGESESWAPEHEDTQALLQRARSGAGRHRVLMSKVFIWGMTAVTLVCFVASFVMIHVIAGTWWSGVLISLLVMIGLVSLTFVGLSIPDPIWFKYLCSVVVAWTVLLSCGVALVVIGVRRKIPIRFQFGVIFISIAMAGYLQLVGLWIWVRTPREREAFRLAWGTGVVEVQQFHTGRCFLEAREWIRVSLMFPVGFMAELLALLHTGNAFSVAFYVLSSVND
jgi:hypothetical protein